MGCGPRTSAFLKAVTISIPVFLTPPQYSPQGTFALLTTGLFVPPLASAPPGERTAWSIVRKLGPLRSSRLGRPHTTCHSLATATPRSGGSVPGAS